jgi:lysine N6-hydroxylase
MKREVYAIDSGTTFQAFTPQENNQFAQLSDK